MELSKKLMKTYKGFPLIAIILLVSTFVGGVIAYTFWSSSIFSTTITVESVLPVKINIDDVTPFPDFSAVTTIGTFHAGNMLRFAVDEANNNVQDDLNLTISATGAYITAGGTVGASIQRYTIDISDTISALGSAIVIADVNLMDPTLLVDIAETGTPGSAYVEVTLTPNGGPGWGDYALDIVLSLSDGA